MKITLVEFRTPLKPKFESYILSFYFSFTFAAFVNKFCNKGSK